MTEKKLSSADERKLTQAIERAATLASVDESKDRSGILANCLKEANVGTKFAKVASDAFNKRLTVLTFQHTKDEDRTKSFPLADADRVASALGGDACIGTLEKRASIRTSGFAADVIGATQHMTKVAAASSSVPKRINYEDRVTPDMLMTHLESMMQKQAAAHATMMGQLNTLSAKIEHEKDKIHKELTKLGAFEFQNICNVYGDDLVDIMGDSIAGRKLRKTAGAVRKGTSLERAIDTLISDIDNYVTINNGLASYQAGLSEFCKTAADIGNKLIKTAGPSLLAGDLLRYGTAVGMTGLTSGIKAGEQISDAINAAVGNIDARWEAAKKHTARPDKYLDSEFLLKDRYNDRLLIWSDMAADPLFAQYPAEQVFMATQKAMDMDLSLERPDRREALRAEVAQLLAQNGRVSTADIAALATTIRGLESSKGNAAAAAAAVVSALDKKEAPAAVELKDIVQRDVNAKWRTRDYMAEAEQKSKDAHEAEEREKDREISRAAAERAKVDWEQRQEDRAYNLEQRAKDEPLHDLERQTKLQDLRNKDSQQQAEIAAGKYEATRLEAEEKDKLKLSDLELGNRIAAAEDIKLLNEARVRAGLTPFTRAETAAMIELKKNDEARYEAAVHEAMKATNANYLSVPLGVTDKTREEVTRRTNIENSMDEALKRREVIDGENAALAARGTTHGEVAGNTLTYALKEQALKEKLQSKRHAIETANVTAAHDTAQAETAARRREIKDAGGIKKHIAAIADRIFNKRKYEGTKEGNDLVVGNAFEAARSKTTGAEAQTKIDAHTNNITIDALGTAATAGQLRGLMGGKTINEHINNVVIPHSITVGELAAQGAARKHKNYTNALAYFNDPSASPFVVPPEIPDISVYGYLSGAAQADVNQAVQTEAENAAKAVVPKPKTK